MRSPIQLHQQIPRGGFCEILAVTDHAIVNLAVLEPVYKFMNGSVRICRRLGDIDQKRVDIGRIEPLDTALDLPEQARSDPVLDQNGDELAVVKDGPY